MKSRKTIQAGKSFSRNRGGWKRGIRILNGGQSPSERPSVPLPNWGLHGNRRRSLDALRVVTIRHRIDGDLTRRVRGERFAIYRGLSKDNKVHEKVQCLISRDIFHHGRKSKSSIKEHPLETSSLHGSGKNVEHTTEDNSSKLSYKSEGLLPLLTNSLSRKCS